MNRSTRQIGTLAEEGIIRSDKGELYEPKGKAENFKTLNEVMDKGRFGCFRE